MIPGPIRIFVGADADNCDLESQAVIEWSIRKHTTRAVVITWMQAGHGPWAGWQSGRSRTPFTNFRWSVPDVCGYEGRAIYWDSDVIVVADVGRLWDQPIPQVGLVRNAWGKLTTSCILWDCAAAKAHVPGVASLRQMRDAHGTMLKYFRGHLGYLTACTGDWDCIDLKGYADLADPRIQAVHYSRIETQVHLKHALPRLASEGRRHWYQGPTGPHPRPELQAVFDAYLREAIDHGYPPERYRIASAGAVPRKPFVYHTSQV